MEYFPWWTQEQKAFADEINAFVNEAFTEDIRTRWKREFPWEMFKKAGERGYTGVGIPKEYGGLGLGATGASIAAEAFGRMPGPGRVFVGNMLGGLRQIIEFGTEEQKKRFLPRIAKGELGAIVITEPFVGTDAASIETKAKREGDVYILNGKKRYIVSAGLATRHMVYVRTSNDPEDIKNYRHLTAFIIEKGTPGLSVEKINEIIGFKNIQNGVLNFHNVPVPVENRIGQEGEGWRVMTAGLNFERTLISALVSGWIGELLRNTVPYTQRRVQFGRPTIDIPTNQLKIADLIIKFKIARLMAFYTAYLWDLGVDITIESNAAKVFNCESAMQASIDAIQVVGGDAVTPFYPWEEIMNVSKVETIAGGTMEACRLVIFRAALRQMAKEFKMPRRVIDSVLGVPIPVSEKIEKKKDINEEELLGLLAEDYRVNPGLFMSRADIKEFFDVDDATLDELLTSLENKGLVKLYRSKKGIELAKATYEGLNAAHPLEYYKWFPSWINESRIF
ncbi:MAG TPA: acyl-CoA dehydrogenase family protein [Syntrophorhabdaceae bacterium]|nr:acyl-CoA dehydrogenase family protein [Syntrophorhabdaceae bacterium]